MFGIGYRNTVILTTQTQWQIQINLINGIYIEALKLRLQLKITTYLLFAFVI